MSDKIETENTEQEMQKTMECDKIVLCKRKFMKDLMLGRFWKLLGDVKLTPTEWKPIFRLHADSLSWYFSWSHSKCHLVIQLSHNLTAYD